MKKRMHAVFVLLAAALLSASVLGCSKKAETQPGQTDSASNGKTASYHIGIATGTVSQSEDDLRGAEKLIEMYGSAKTGGMIQHITYPDDFMSQQETTITQIAALADDPLMKAIIVNQGIPGTAEAF